MTQLGNVHEEFRRLFESRIHGDTGTGGLRNASSNAVLRGVYYAVRPSEPAYPHVFYNFVVNNRQTSDHDYAEIVCQVEIDARSRHVSPLGDYSGASNDFSVHQYGFGRSGIEGTIAAVMDRMHARFVDNFMPVPSGAGLWKFAPPSFGQTPQGVRVNEEFSRLAFSWIFAAEYVKGLGDGGNNSDQPLSGSGMKLVIQTVSAASASGEASASSLTFARPFAYSFQATQGFFDVTRPKDRWQRLTYGGAKGGRLSVRFEPRGLGSVMTPTLDSRVFPASGHPGAVYKVTLTTRSGQDIVLRGFIENSTLAASKRGGFVQGGFSMRTSPLFSSMQDDALLAPVNPNFGVTQ